MNAYPNHTKHQLAAGKLALGMGLRQARTCDIAAIAKTSGFDWLFIDMEHSSLDVDTAAQIANAALAVGITPIVRVPGRTFSIQIEYGKSVINSIAEGTVDAIHARAREAASGQAGHTGHTLVFLPGVHEMTRRELLCL